MDNSTAAAEFRSQDATSVAWVLTSTSLVLFMTPGLAFFYGGLVRRTSIINTLMMSLIAMGVVTITWSLIGFSIAFGADGPYPRFFGDTKYFLLMNLDMKLWEDTDVPGLGFATFQMSFAIISSAIISGSLVERVRFSMYIFFIAAWCLIVYAPLCHWVWGPGGWIQELGALDFAGGLVVHISSGVSGLTAAKILGPRKGFGRVAEEHHPSNVPFVLLGAGILWFGWNGFNGGSAITVGNGLACRAICTTNLAAAAAMCAWVSIEWSLQGRPSSVGAMVGAVSGLVVITPSAGFVSPAGAICIGLLGAPICYGTIHAMNTAMKVDDSLDAFGLHGTGGIAGALLIPFFALDGGLFYSGGFDLMRKQLISVVAAVAWSSFGTALILIPMKKFLRMRADGETSEHRSQGLDQLQHGELAYSVSMQFMNEGRTSTGRAAAPLQDTIDEDGSASNASESD